MPDNHRRSLHPVAVTTTVSRDLAERLETRAKLQGLSRAETLRNLLIAALPAPSPRRTVRPWI